LKSPVKNVPVPNVSRTPPVGRWMKVDALVDELIDGLRRAGLSV
jgi:hypothetical protein